MKTGFLYLVLLAAFAICANGLEPAVLWHTGFSNCGGSVVWDVTAASSGGYVAVGEISFGASEETALSICRVDSDGFVLWENTALSLGNASAFAIEGLSDGFVLCGVCSDSSGKHGLVLKIDSSGSTVWSLDVGFENDDALLDLCLTPEGNILAVGYSVNSETSANDILAVCVSDSGSVLWQKRYIDPHYQTAYSIIQSLNSEPGFTLTGSDNGDVFLMQIDSQGNWLWKANHPLEGNQMGRSVTASAYDGYIVAGSTRGSSGYSDALLVFFDKDGKAISDHVWGTNGPGRCLFYSGSASCRICCPCEFQLGNRRGLPSLSFKI